MREFLTCMANAYTIMDQWMESNIENEKCIITHLFYVETWNVMLIGVVNI